MRVILSQMRFFAFVRGEILNKCQRQPNLVYVSALLPAYKFNKIYLKIQNLMHCSGQRSIKTVHRYYIART